MSVSDKKSYGSTSRYILVGTIIALLLFIYGFIFFLLGVTVVTWWIPASVALFLAAAFGILFWRKWRFITESDNFLLNYLCNLVAVTGLTIAMFLGANYFFARNDTLHEEKAVVENKYHKIRHHSKRVTRRVYTQGTPYKVYFIRIRFNDGMEKEIELKYDKFKKLSKGDSISLNLEDGLFHLPVIKWNSSHVDVPESSYRKQFSSFNSPVESVRLNSA